MQVCVQKDLRLIFSTAFESLFAGSCYLISALYLFPRELCVLFENFSQNDRRFVRFGVSLFYRVLAGDAYPC